MFLGLDPGGDSQFGWCLLEGTECPLSLLRSGCASHAAEAVQSALNVLGPSRKIQGVGIDSPLFWSLSGSRLADCIVRQEIKKAGAPNAGGTVQHVNSLRGACLVQGVVAAHLLREAMPEVRITEAHPKALLWLIEIASANRRVLDVTMDHLEDLVSCDAAGLPEHERDAALGAVAAWAMSSAAPGWRNIALDEKDCFVPTPPVEYWMPIALPSDVAIVP